MIIIAGVDFRLANGGVHVVAESRPAIYAFALAGIWSLIQGECVAHHHRRVSAPYETTAAAADDPDPTNLGCCGRPLPGARSRSLRSPLLLVLTSLFGLVLHAAGSLGVPAFTFNVTDNSGAVAVHEYRVITLANLTTSVAHARPQEDASGPAFLAFVYVAIVIALPLVTGLSLLVRGGVELCAPGMRLSKRVTDTLAAVDVLSCFSSPDVFVVAATVTNAEFGHLVDAVGGSLLSCGAAEDGKKSVVAHGTVEAGMWLTLAGALVMYVAQVLGARIHAEAEGRRRNHAPPALALEGRKGGGAKGSTVVMAVSDNGKDGALP